jgi:hypothetical protein
VLVFLPAVFSYSRTELGCGVCQSLVDEMNVAIEATAETFVVQTRWRIDEKKKIPYARTEHRLLEILETELASALNKYGVQPQPTRLHHAANDNDGTSSAASAAIQFPFLKLVKTAGVSDQDVKSGKDVTTDIQSTYEHLVEEYLEEIMLLFHRDENDIKQKLCIDLTQSCQYQHWIHDSVKFEEREGVPPATTEEALAAIAAQEASKTTTTESEPAASSNVHTEL